jgi:hypothetical protein
MITSSDACASAGGACSREAGGDFRVGVLNGVLGYSGPNDI